MPRHILSLALLALSYWLGSMALAVAAAAATGVLR